jgi:hypothetical protein
MCVRLYESIEVAFNFALLACLLVGGGKGGKVGCCGNWHLWNKE